MAHGPLLSFAVGVTAVIDESCVVRLLLCVYHEPIPAVQSEHVEVLSAGLVRSLKSLVTHLHVQNLTHVLHHEIPLIDIGGRLQPPPTSARVERNGFGVLASAHLLVLAEFPDRAGFGVALHVDCSVDTDRVIVARALWRALTWEGMEVIARDRRARNQVLVDLHIENVVMHSVHVVSIHVHQSVDPAKTLFEVCS